MRVTPTIVVAGALGWVMALSVAGALGREPSARTRPGADAPLILQSQYARWRASLPEDYPRLADYRRVVLRWVRGAEPYWIGETKRPKLGPCQMRSRHVPVCTARALPVYAALAADDGLNDAEWTREKLGRRLNAAIALLCATYSPDKPRKGCWAKQPRRNSLRYETWIIGNMLDVLQIAPGVVTAENKRRIREILIDIVEDERTSGRARSLRDYRHEGITWTMNLLARGALLYPDHANAAEWLDLAKHGYASSLSVEADAKDETVLDGKGVREWVARRRGVFHPDFTLTHHGLGIHPGYMGFASHRMVSLHEMLAGMGKTPSPIWRLHYRDVAAVIKGLALWDGRMAYPNGKDWADYLYGVSAMRFQMVGLQMMFSDGEARLLEKGLFRTLDWLQRARGGGDFGPSNAEYTFNVNDAKNIAFAYRIRQRHAPARCGVQAAFDRAHTRVFHSPHGSFVFVRDPRRFASWGWRAGKAGTTGLIVPRARGLGDHLAQWDGGFAPQYWTQPAAGRRQALGRRQAKRAVETFAGGFAVSEVSGLSAGAGPADVTDHRVMVALPDGRTVLVAAAGRAVRPVRRLATADVNWRFVRSIFSDSRRTVFHEAGRQECLDVRNVATRWLNVDGVIGVVCVGEGASLSCVPAAEARKGEAHAGQTVRASVRSLPPRDYEVAQEVFSACLVFVTDLDAGQTARSVGRYGLAEGGEDVRVVRIGGQDGRRYVVAVNFGGAERRVALPEAGAKLLTPRSARPVGGAKLLLPPRACALLVR